MPYTKDDAAYFFGRERERELITANLMASRLTLLYGASGVGKSSVLNAGVVFQLHERALGNVAAGRNPESVVVAFSSWRDDPVQGLQNQIGKTAKQFTPSETGAFTNNASLVDFLRDWTERLESELLIILDQFEEYFLYHSGSAEGSFAAELPRAINRPDLRVNFLISIREDSLAKMDFFKGRIPNLFDNYLRIEHLGRQAARSAITKPLKQYNLTHGDLPSVTIEDKLVEMVLDQVKVGEVAWSGSGLGTIKDAEHDDRIETPYLQLVMTRLWDEEAAAGIPMLRLETLERLGGATSIVRTHLDKILSGFTPQEQNSAATVFRYLVTPSGSKIALTVADLNTYTELHESHISGILLKLSSHGVHILRPVNPPSGVKGETRYEIFHDVLATTILDWRTRHVARQELASAQRKLVSLILPFVIGIVCDAATCFMLPLGTLVVWAMLRSKMPPLKKELMRALIIGWILGWTAGFIVGWGSYILLAFYSPSWGSGPVSAVMPFVVVILFVVPRLFPAFGSAIAFLSWRRTALAKLGKTLSAGVRVTPTLTEQK